MKRYLGVLILVGIMALFSACSLFGKGEEVDPDGLYNVALGKTATASSIFDGGSGVYPPHLAVDGKYGRPDRWMSAIGEEPPHWLEIDLEGTFTISSAEIHTGNGDGSTNNPVIAFELQYWDDGEWKQIPGASVEDNDSAIVNLSFDEPVETTKVRFYSDATPPSVEGIRVVRVVEIIIMGKEVES